MTLFAGGIPAIWERIYNQMKNQSTCRKEIRVESGHIDSVHPVTLLLFFLYVLFFTMFCQNPVVIIVSLFFSIISEYMICGRRELLRTFRLIIPVGLLTFIINPLFNHRGRTVLFYLPGGNALTFESIMYGIMTALLFAAVICWFAVFNRIFSSDKILYLLGRVSPSMSLVLSMTLRFVPEFRQKADEIKTSQKMLYPKPIKGFRMKVMFLSAVMSSLVTWSIEHGVIKSYTMKNRGYGINNRRTGYHLYSVKKNDIIYMIIMTLLMMLLFVMSFNDVFDFWFFPTFYGSLFAKKTVMAVSYTHLTLPTKA